MGDGERGFKWWIRFVFVPVLGSSGVAALILAYANRPQPPAPVVRGPKYNVVYPSQGNPQVPGHISDRRGGADVVHVSEANNLISPPKSLPRPTPHTVEAPQSIQIGDFSLGMKECGHIQGVVRCEGTIENEGDFKAQMTFTSGSTIDNKGNKYELSQGPYYLFSPGILFFGSANVSQELMPRLPVKFGFDIRGLSDDTTAMNFILKFSTTGTPRESEVVFRDIPIHE